MSNQEVITTVYAVSDSIGETAETVAKATASQFGSIEFDIVRIPYMSNEEQLERLLNEASKQKCLICYTMVSPTLREFVRVRAEHYGIIAVDILGPLLDGFEKASGNHPHNKPGLVRSLDTDYFRRVEAVEFAVKYDDGKNPWGILKADVVLVGISRTSKTPLSMYLAHKRIKVANVPLVPEINPPEELFQIPAKKIVGLIINPYKLNNIRAERLKTMGLNETASYAKIQRINDELEYAQKIMREIGCTVIDVSNRAIEETAGFILDHVRKNNLVK